MQIQNDANKLKNSIDNFVESQKIKKADEKKNDEVFLVVFGEDGIYINDHLVISKKSKIQFEIFRILAAQYMQKVILLTPERDLKTSEASSYLNAQAICEQKLLSRMHGMDIR